MIDKKFIERQIENLLRTTRNSRGLQVSDLLPKISATLEKYLFRDAPDASESEVKEFLESLQKDDLCLVTACEKGDETAWNELVTNFNQTVKSAARRIAPNVEEAEDLASSIWAELHGLKQSADGKKRGKLGYYSGCGSLGGWLRAVVAQLAVDAYRKQARFVQIEETREFEHLANSAESNGNVPKIVQTVSSPAEIYDEKSVTKAVAEALKKAVSQMEAEDRLLVKLYYFDNLNLKQAGAALGFHEATASRRIARIHGDLRKKTEKILQTEYGWRAEEIKRNLTEAAEKTGINVEKMFAALLVAFILQETWLFVVLHSSV